MNIRLYNARILTMEPGREVFYGEVWVKNEQDYQSYTLKELLPYGFGGDAIR